MELKRLELEIAIPEELMVYARDILDETKRISALSVLAYSETAVLVILDVEWEAEERLDLAKSIPFVSEVQRLGAVADSHLYVADGHNPPILSEFIRECLLDLNVFIDLPIVAEKEKAYIPFVGREEQVKAIPTILESLGVEQRIRSLKNYRLTGPGLLAGLTTRQYKCLKMAVKEGYYDIPKGIDIRDLAKRTGVAHTTLSLHLRKAERSIMKGLFE